MKSIEQQTDIIIEALEELKSKDVMVLDVRAQSNFTDIMIIASGSSDRQTKAICNKVMERAKEHAIPIIGVEGEQTGDWILVDLGDIVVHIMLPATRDFYQLEKLWGMATNTCQASGNS